MILPIIKLASNIPIVGKSMMQRLKMSVVGVRIARAAVPIR